MYSIHSDHHLVIIQKGEHLVETITNYAREHSLKGGLISGLGAIEEVELGCYDCHNKEYLRKIFNKSEYELISLIGNISHSDGDFFTHVHASMSGKDFQAFGGHLFEAQVAVTTEVFISPLGKLPQRQYDKAIGINLICGIRS